MARATHIIDLVGELTKMPSVEKRIDVVSQMDGVAALIRTKDGNAYEVQIRPASMAQHPTIQKRVAKKS